MIAVCPRPGENINTLLVYGLPIALAALLVPTLAVLAPSMSAPRPGTTMAWPYRHPRQWQVRLSVSEWSFNPKQLRLPTGKPVTLVPDNTGKLEHDVTIPSLGVSLKAPAGKSATQTVMLIRNAPLISCARSPATRKPACRAPWSSGV